MGSLLTRNPSQICTELLFQPLTVLDCLHTFCGACLKEWFGWQALAAETAPTPPAPGSPIFTCPSCRAPVRDTRHNATVATLLDMFLAANPEKARPEADRESVNAKYKPGDNILPTLNIQERSAEQLRLDDEDRRLVDEIRELSLRESVASTALASGATLAPSTRARRLTDGRSFRDRRSGPGSRDTSRESHPERRARDARERQRAGTHDDARQRSEQRVMLQPENVYPEDGRRRQQRSRPPSVESSGPRERHVDHQISIRSLINSADTDSRYLQSEIEEFARQIQEEGLLEGLDLDNIDLSSNDELSKKITDAYRRRHRERTRKDRARWSSANARDRTRSRDRSSGSQAHSRGRYPPSSSTQLEVLETRQSGRTPSAGRAGRSSTTPVMSTAALAQGAARLQTDLPTRTQSSEQTRGRPSLDIDIRSSSTPTVATAIDSIQPRSVTAQSELLRSSGLPFRARVASAEARASAFTAQPGTGTSCRCEKRAIQPSNITTDSNRHSSPSLASPRSRPHYYPEPSISCSSCGKQHIEYELHYNCQICEQGNWNLCLACYRRGKGCHYWFGFGYGAFMEWERRKKIAGNSRMDAPHMLTSNRYLPPKAIPGGADGHRTLTTEDPYERLQSGTFCQRCFAWTNECYWRCDSCNLGDWGFCNDCVNQGFCCTHPLLPLSYQSPTEAGSQSQAPTPPTSPRAPCPATARLLTGSHATNVGGFRPLMFIPPCQVCEIPVQPTQYRHHCYTCTPSLLPRSPYAVPGAGDYDICDPCYVRLVADGTISAENGVGGWRRCPQGHRTVVLVFLETRDGQRRCIIRDLVGGHKLHLDLVSGAAGLQLAQWYEGEQKLERLVTLEAGASTKALVDSNRARLDPGLLGRLTDKFPRNGGSGAAGTARWAWWRTEPDATDELLFPKGAEITEIEDANKEWFFGVYMGAKGLFPGAYLKMTGPKAPAVQNESAWMNERP